MAPPAEPDVVGHSNPPSQRPTAASIVFICVVVVILIVWVIEEIASTLGYAPAPDPTLTLVISSLVGALATLALRTK